mmetsp:Transcript_96397/g.276872  ORF Transcript_96397/g.276872 Transcript_96397/m.276872 type:complete len:248 (-) Transcript_96397:233-976(-)
MQWQSTTRPCLFNRHSCATQKSCRSTFAQQDSLTKCQTPTQQSSSLFSNDGLSTASSAKWQREICRCSSSRQATTRLSTVLSCAMQSICRESATTQGQPMIWKFTFLKRSHFWLSTVCSLEEARFMGWASTISVTATGVRACLPLTLCRRCLLASATHSWLSMSGSSQKMVNARWVRLFGPWSKSTHHSRSMTAASRLNRTSSFVPMLVHTSDGLDEAGRGIHALRAGSRWHPNFLRDSLLFLREGQ